MAAVSRMHFQQHGYARDRIAEGVPGNILPDRNQDLDNLWHNLEASHALIPQDPEVLN